MADRKLDRLVQFDERSRNFQVRMMLDMAPKKPPRTTHWHTGTTLDQGREGACVGFGISHRLEADPVRQPHIDANSAVNLYHRARELDDYPGEDYDGTSVLGGAKAAAEKGYFSEYRWIGAGSGTPMEDIMDTLTNVGPIVFGLAWCESMFEPRPSGLLEVDTSKVAGGHCIHAPWLYLHSRLKGEPGVRDFVGFQNSWGPDWGVRGGMCYIKMEDLERLMGMDGEGLVITKEKLVK